MTQADFTIANQTFPNTRTEINTSLQALATNSAGNSAPSTTFPNQWHFDSDGNTLYMRNKDNDAWVTILTIGATSDKVESIGVDDLTFADDSKLILGTGGDLEIFHGSDNSFIQDVGAGNLIIKSSAVKLQSAGGEDMLVATQDGSVQLYHNNVKKLETSADGISVTGTGTFTTDDNTDTLSLISTDADGTSGPNLRFYRNSSSPDAGDDLGRLEFEGRNANSEDVIYGRIRTQLRDKTDGSEDGKMDIGSILAGTTIDWLTFDPADPGGASVVFNQGSNDVNFRIESNDNSDMLNINAGTNIVGIAGPPDLGVGLHIRTADSGASVHATGDDLVIEGSGNAGLSILSGNTSEGVVYFGDTNDNNVGRIVYDHNLNHIALHTSGSEQVRLHSNGVLSASDGIALGVGTANTASNVLDDYEEGTYTPAFTVGSGSLTVHGSHNTLAYTKIGRVVHVQGEMRFSAVSSPSGNFSLSLPFAVADLAEGAARFTSAPIGQSGFNGTPNQTYYMRVTGEGVDTAFITTHNSGSDTGVNANQVTTNTEMIVSFTMIAA